MDLVKCIYLVVLGIHMVLISFSLFGVGKDSRMAEGVGWLVGFFFFFFFFFLFFWEK